MSSFQTMLRQGLQCLIWNPNPNKSYQQPHHSDTSFNFNNTNNTNTNNNYNYNSNNINIKNKNQEEFRNLEVQARRIWMLYVEEAVRQAVDVQGIFYFQKNFNHHNKDQQDELNSEKEEEENDQDQENKQLIKQKQQQIQPFQRRTRGRPKKTNPDSTQSTSQPRPSLLLQLRRKMSSLQQTIIHSPLHQQFLQYTYNLEYHQTDLDDGKVINFVANKYAAFLVRESRGGGGGGGGGGLGRIKVPSLKVRVGELERVARGTEIGECGDKREIVLGLLLEGLLRLWSQELNLQKNHSLQNLLLLYSTPQNSLQKPLITSTIGSLLSHIESSTPPPTSCPLPPLSYSLLYAILYLAACRAGLVLTINDVMIACGSVRGTYRGRKVEREARICRDRVRKLVGKIAGVVGEGVGVGVGVGVEGFVLREVEVCGLKPYANQILQFSKTLMSAYTSKQTQKIPPYQHETISKSLILMFLKLQLGLDTQPYLSTISPKILTQIQHLQLDQQKKKQYIDVIGKVLETRPSISIADVLQNLDIGRGRGSDQARRVRVVGRVGGYADVGDLECRELIGVVRQSGEQQGFYAIPNLSHIPKPNPPLPYTLTPPLPSTQSLTLSQKFKIQLQLAAEQLQTNTFFPQQLDLPSCNYQLIYQYLQSIHHCQRPLLALLAQKLCGVQCRVKELYKWVQKLEAVLVVFEK